MEKKTFDSLWSMENRLIDRGLENDVQDLEDIQVLKTQWPEEPILRYSEAKIRPMARRFNVTE